MDKGVHPMPASQRMSERLHAAERMWRSRMSSALKDKREWDRTLALWGGVFLLGGGLLLGLGLPPDDSMPSPWNRVGQVAGWMYFLAWASCSYPQTLSNWQRKSVVGFSLDFALINPIGFLCLTAYYGTLYLNPAVRRQYRRVYGVHLGVHINDIFFAVHALALTLVMGWQCCVYERGSQRVSHLIAAAVAVMTPATLVYLLLVIVFPDYFTALAFITYLSWIKMVVTLVKYLPQFLLNRQRKSTTGWSIWMVLLDFTGGLFSMFQLCLEAWVLSDINIITGDAIKFGLGGISMVYNVLFILQHYVWYAESMEGQEPDLELSPLSPAEDFREAAGKLSSFHKAGDRLAIIKAKA